MKGMGSVAHDSDERRSSDLSVTVGRGKDGVEQILISERGPSVGNMTGSYEYVLREGPSGALYMTHALFRKTTLVLLDSNCLSLSSSCRRKFANMLDSVG